jgi:hypothetical protein
MKINNIPCSCGKAKPAKTKVEFPDGDYFLCGDSECRDSLEIDLIHLNQGRRDESLEFSEKVVFWSIIGFGLVAFICIIQKIFGF